MSSLSADDIGRIFAEGTKFKGNFDSDLSQLLEEYLSKFYLEQGEFPNFHQAAYVIRDFSTIYSRNVDQLFSMVLDAAHNQPSNVDETPEETSIRRTRKRVEFVDFKNIVLEEASNIYQKDCTERKPIAMLPKAFMQFEPRVISENDVVIRDYKGESIGLMNDYRVNWNTDENFMLCDDMDFCSSNKPSITKLKDNQVAAIVSPSDSGNASDFCLDFPADNSEEIQGFLSSVADAAVTTEIEVVKRKKRKIDSENVEKKPVEIRPFPYLSGSFPNIRNVITDFTLPSFAVNIIKQRKMERNELRNFILEIHSADMDCEVFMNNLSPGLKKKPCLSWSRKEVIKRLKLSGDTPDKVEGFSDDEDLTEQLENLNKACSKLCLENPDDDFDRFSDGIPENCYIGSQNSIFEPSIARRLAEADMHPSPCSFTEQSDITKRVEAWHASIQEKLKITENRKTFNVKSYSEDIHQSFKSKGENKINFSDVLTDKPPEDLARYFLTTLMLANESKITIDQPEPLSCGDFQFSINPDASFDDDLTL